MGLFTGSMGFVAGFAAGFGTGYWARDYGPSLKGAASPALKLMLKSGMIAAERSREGLARLGETLQDLMAEAQMEMKERRNAQARKGKKKRKAASAHPAREADVIPLREKRGTT